jgi:two-component system, sensor histidine kinase and response regulator
MLDERINKFLKMGSCSSALLLALIEDILDLSKIDAGTFSLNMSPFMIPELLDEIHEIFEYQCKQKALELLIEIDPAFKDQRCKSDKARIRQILMNLVSNALKFTFNGHIKIKVELTSIQNKLFIQFKVSDTGMGIPKNEQKKLFKLFGMLDINKNVNKNGCGIGLAVSQKYVEALGGKIWIDSEYQKGSTFAFTIPYLSHFQALNRSFEELKIDNEIITKMNY